MSTPPPGFTLHPLLAKTYDARKEVGREKVASLPLYSGAILRCCGPFVLPQTPPKTWFRGKCNTLHVHLGNRHTYLMTTCVEVSINNRRAPNETNGITACTKKTFRWYHLRSNLQFSFYQALSGWMVFHIYLFSRKPLHGVCAVLCFAIVLNCRYCRLSIDIVLVMFSPQT